jgi:hypothetical protein
MGSGFSALAENILLEFDKNDSMIYQTDEIISGTAKFLNDAEFELKLNSVIIELVGEIVYITTRGSGPSKTTDIHVVSFFTKQQNIRMAEKGSSFVLESGNHTWPFAFPLIDSLPSTLEQTRHRGPFVRYVVRVQLILSEWYKKKYPKNMFYRCSICHVSRCHDGKQRR